MSVVELPEGIVKGLGSVEGEIKLLCVQLRQAQQALADKDAEIEMLLLERLGLRKENRKFALKATLLDRMPFCPDHRDKVQGKECRECEIGRLRAERDKLRGVVSQIAESSPNWMVPDAVGDCLRRVQDAARPAAGADGDKELPND